jgi:hypothetical protein
MPARFALPVTLLVALVAAACGAPAGGEGPPPPAPTPGPTPPGHVGIPFVPSPSPKSGDVESVYPELTIEVLDGGRLVVGVLDPAARAWRVVVSGVGAEAGERMEILVETSDIGPIIEIREIRNGTVVDVADLSTIVADRIGAAGGCHSTLGVCYSSDGFRLPQQGNGELLVRLDIRDTGTLQFTGATAGWDGEPFILGPWEETESFLWPTG